MSNNNIPAVELKTGPLNTITVSGHTLTRDIAKQLDCISVYEIPERFQAIARIRTGETSGVEVLVLDTATGDLMRIDVESVNRTIGSFGTPNPEANKLLATLKLAVLPREAWV